MHIADILTHDKVHFSFEFFPPKTDEASNALFETIKQLLPIDPSFVSVTYGAGGSGKRYTQELVVRLRRETPLNIAAHLTAIGASQADIKEQMDKYVEAGIDNVVALRGDPPKGSGAQYQPGEKGFMYAAEMVAYIKKNYPRVGIGVAGFPEGHPETPNRLKEMDYLKAKVDSGADYICTQLFFDNHVFYDFCERCQLAGINVPILAGIMPVTSLQSLHKIADLALGSHIPAKLLRAISRAENDAAIEKIGTHWATEQVFDLYDNNIHGIHFYTLNHSKATIKICQRLGLSIP